MDKIRPYSDVEIRDIASWGLLPASITIRAMRLESENQKIYVHGPSKLLLDHNWVHKTIGELKKEGRIDTEGYWKPNIEFDGDPKFTCHFKTELNNETKQKLLDSINDMLDHKVQDFLKPPCFIEVTEGDNKDCVKVHIIFDSFIGTDHEKGE